MQVLAACPLTVGLCCRLHPAFPEMGTQSPKSPGTKTAPHCRPRKKVSVADNFLVNKVLRQETAACIPYKFIGRV